ncbi:MAG: FAD-binding oxidoreductase [Myxococcota bacterium]
MGTSGTDATGEELWRAGSERLSGFGGAQTGVCSVLRPHTSEELEAALEWGRREGLALGLRGAGRSYGDAALNSGGAVLDLCGLDRILAWDPATGIAEVEPGVTLDRLWRHTIGDGWWPAVVPGTSLATIGGIVAMNAHGKNCFRVGPSGDHVLELEVLLASGERVTCGPERRRDLFETLVGGFGMLGCIVRVRLRLKRIHSGHLRVQAIPVRSITEMVDVFEAETPRADYAVGWSDGLAPERRLGRGVVHLGFHLEPGEDPTPARGLRPEAQAPPPRMLGVLPRTQLWRALRLVQHWPGMRSVNLVKSLAHRLDPRRSTLWTHAEYGFLLDYAPGFNRSYGPSGLIQVQPFVPADRAAGVFSDVLRLARSSGIPPHLVVFKRHRSDRFVLSHGLDGYSLALDFPARRRARLWALAREIQERTIDAGGRFYLAKDSTLTPDQLERQFEARDRERFLRQKRACDPAGLFRTDLSRRVWPVLHGADCG